MTLVVDASAYVEFAIGSDAPRRQDVIAAVGDDGRWLVPEHFRLEVAQAFRGAWLGGQVAREDFVALVIELSALELEVWPTEPLLQRVAELAANATAYDAAYVALAEQAECRLVTADRRFLGIPGIRCQVVGAVS